MKHTLSLTLAFAAGGACLCYPPADEAAGASEPPATAPVFTAPAPSAAEHDVAAAVFARFPEAPRREVMDLIQKHFPAEFYEFRSLAARDRRQATGIMSETVVEALNLLGLRRDHPARFEKLIRQRELESRAGAQAREWQRLAPPEREPATAALRRTLEEAFAVKHDIQEDRTALIRADLDKLRDLLAARAKYRDVIVRKQVETLSRPSGVSAAAAAADAAARPDLPPPIPPAPGERALLERVVAAFPGIGAADMARCVEELFPAEVYEFRTLAWRDEEAAARLMSALVRRALDLLRGENLGPDLLDKFVARERLQRRVEELGRRAARATGAHREAALAELAAAAAESFELKQDIWRAKIAQMEMELRELKESLERRERFRDAIVSRRMLELTGDETCARW